MKKLIYLLFIVLFCSSCGEAESHDECVDRYMNEGYSKKDAEHECYEDVNYDAEIHRGG